MQVQPWARKTRCLVVFIAACCAALTELVLDDSNAHQVVQVRGWLWGGAGGGGAGPRRRAGSPLQVARYPRSWPLWSQQRGLKIL